MDKAPVFLLGCWYENDVAYPEKMKPVILGDVLSNSKHYLYGKYAATKAIDK